MLQNTMIPEEQAGPGLRSRAGRWRSLCARVVAGERGKRAEGLSVGSVGGM